MDYDFELDNAIKVINDEKAKLVLVQCADGLKPYTREIVDKLEKETNAKCMIWAGSCFGACDFPLEAKHMGVDLVLQFGHAAWKYRT